MREIKYKAYLKKHDEMVDVYVIDFDGKYIVHEDMQVYDEVDKDPSCSTYFKDCEIVQYTGLKDSKGVEIYEGDLYKRRCSDCAYTLIGKIKYSKHMGAFICVLITAHFCKNSDRWSQSPFFLKGEYIKSRGEVIGNIHQNPEFLETK